MDIANISKYINELDFIKATANQIIKDFDMFGLEIKFSGSKYDAYEELFDQIEPYIDELLSVNRSKFMSVLYRIDVSEYQLKKAVEENESESFSTIITDLIIKRELQKVVIRAHYAQK